MSRHFIRNIHSPSSHSLFQVYCTPIHIAEMTFTLLRITQSCVQNCVPKTTYSRIRYQAAMRKENRCELNGCVLGRFIKSVHAKLEFHWRLMLRPTNQLAITPCRGTPVTTQSRMHSRPSPSNSRTPYRFHTIYTSTPSPNYGVRFKFRV